MHSFQQGDKVRHKATGHVLDVLSVDGNTLEVGFTYADAHVCEWPAGECEPYFENLPKEHHNYPKKEDADKYGNVIVAFHDGSCESFPCDQVSCLEDGLVSYWFHTPFWVAREPLHGANCKGCRFDWKLFQKEKHCENHKWYCDKLKLEHLEPHYINGVPCHLAEV